MIKALTAMCWFVCGLPLSMAQSSSAVPPPTRVETPHLVVTTSVADRPAPGSRLTLLADISPKPKMHVYAPEEKGYLSISLSIERQAGLTVQKAIYPKGERFLFAPTSETQIVYSHPFRIEQPIAVPAATRRAGGTLSVSGVLAYQACDDKVCYVPRKVPLTWKVPLR